MLVILSEKRRIPQVIIKLAPALPCALKARVILAQGEALGHRPPSSSAG
jgi:hypothetical protein